MHALIHGGDIYRNQISLDFSINVNPLGIPEHVEAALLKAVKECDAYPDIHAEQLVRQLGKYNSVPVENIVCANGASELFMALVHARRPARILIPVPSFYGYERAARAAGCEVLYYAMEADGYGLTEAFLEALTEDVDMVFLANPNNPTGKLIDTDLLRAICVKCRAYQIQVILDECFIELAGGKSFIRQPDWMEFPNVCIVRAFTKLYAIPGVRLGYLFCSAGKACDSIREQLPEWNLSCFAQAAGIAALKEEEYCKKSVKLIQKERAYLIKQLQLLGIQVWTGEANFLLLYSEIPLYQELLKQGILIRDCSNYRGLYKGYVRIAVRTHAENKKLIETAGKIIGQNRICKATGN